jgi:hypothetical protein
MYARALPNQRGIKPDISICYIQENLLGGDRLSRPVRAGTICPMTRGMPKDLIFLSCELRILLTYLPREIRSITVSRLTSTESK